MRIIRSIFFGAALAVLFVGGRAQAQITYIGHFKVTSYVQTNADEPVSPSDFYCGITLNSDTNYAISLPTVFSPSTTVDEFIMSENGPSIYGYGSPVYTNKADFDTDYPNGTYDYFVDYPNTNDNNNIESEDIFVSLPDQDIYSPTIPAFTPETWNAFQLMDPAQPLPISWLNYDLDPGADFAHTFIGTYDNQTFNSQYGGFNFDCDPEITGVTIPAGSFDYGRTYGINLYYSDRLSPALENTNGSPIFVIIGFDNVVTAYITTIQPPLRIAPAPDGNVTLSWPTLASNYKLQTTSDLATGGWQDVTDQPTIADGFNSVTLSANQTAAFFKLSPGSSQVFLATRRH